MSLIADIGRDAASRPYVEKLASDSRVGAEVVYHLAEKAGMGPIDFVKKAYASPDEYVLFLKVASGAVGEKEGRVALAKLFYKQASRLQGLGQVLQKVWSKKPVRVGAGVAAAGTGAAGGGVVAHRMLSGDAPAPAAPKPAASKPAAPKPAASKPAAPKPAAQAGAKPDPQAQGGGGGGSGGSGGKAMLAALGLGGAGAGAAYMATRGGKKKEEKKSSDASDLAVRAMRRAIEKKAEQIQKANARKILTAHLDKVASHMTLEKQAQVRVLQGELSRGKNLSEAIKLAYPHLGGEQRGILATQLVRAAVHSHAKRAEVHGCDTPTMKPKTTTTKSESVPLGKAQGRLKAMSS